MCAGSPNDTSPDRGADDFRPSRIPSFGRQETPFADGSVDLPVVVGLEFVVVGADAPAVDLVGGAVVFDGDDMVDLEAVFVLAAFDAADRVGAFEPAAQLGGDGPIRRRDLTDLAVLVAQDRDARVVQESARHGDGDGADAG